MYFLTINAGSSSIKFCLFDTTTLAEDYTGSIAGIGFDTATFSVTDSSGQKERHELTLTNHASAGQLLQEWLEQRIARESIAAIGHRIVHGGPLYSKSVVITDDVMAKLSSIIPLDPEHLPNQVALVDQLRHELPDVPQIACFDTAFFYNLPTVAQLLPIPRKYTAEGIRRYGFHGLSYSYLLQEFERVAGSEAAHGKVIFAHLGNGASLAALQGGEPIDTSMGLTPAGGIPMSTRSGDLDPGLLTYLATEKNMSAEELGHMTGFESGLLGISETSSDMKKLLGSESDDSRAKEAVDIFCYQTRKFIGAYAAALGGLDSLVFSGGIGEVSAAIRGRICNGLDFLGISLDDDRNKANSERISVDGARVGVHVLATNEALSIARDMQQIVTKNN
ncbi:acetate/propionate family kinase [soil metagenome]